jgi:hypothetical protein
MWDFTKAFCAPFKPKENSCYQILTRVICVPLHDCHAAALASARAMFLADSETVYAMRQTTTVLGLVVGCLHQPNLGGC